LKEPIMHAALLPQANATNAIKSGLATLAYRCLAAMQAITPYLFAALFVVLSPGARAAAPAESFVQQNIDKGYGILNDASLTAQDRSGKFRTLLQSIMDSKRVALFTLGVYARSASPAQIEDFSTTFSEFVAAVMQHDIGGNPGQTLTVTGSVVRAPDDVIVTAKLTGPARANGAPIDMGFRIRKDENGADTVVDLQVQGVSMAMAQRSDFTAWLQQHHGNLPALTAELASRTKQFRELDAPSPSATTASAR
jgi:phospholipid transport system substrate-binding protein